MNRGRPRIIAHRGANLQAPENTLIAFKLAADLGADMVEMDLRSTRDGELVVLHDACVERTTDGAGAVGALDAAQVRELDAGRWMGEQFAGERVPILDEVLAQVEIGLTLELKGLDLDAASRAVEQVQRAGRQHDVVLVSRHCEVIDHVRQRDPAMRVSCYQHDVRRWMEHAAAHGPPRHWHSDILHAPAERLEPHMVRWIQDSGRGVVTELPRRQIDPRQVLRLARMGVDGLVTEDVEALAAALAMK